MDEVGFYYEEGRAAAQMRAEQLNLVIRLGYAILIAALGFVAWAIFPNGLDYAIWFWIGAGVSVLLYGGMGLIRISNVRKDISRQTRPLAVGLNRVGLKVGELWCDWVDVARISMRPATAGSALRLELRGQDGRTCWVPIGYADVTPASLDQSVKAYSAELCGVDLSRLDV
ncbi:MAG: hypothetical protein LBR20_02580 [Propionibacteriaceae bacterium]|jgi:hypothetical protein|nr:hypothetical protein [Propionibacteriaceae bacterium]